MKKLCLPLLLTICLLLSACGGREFSDAHEQLSQRLGAVEALSFTANVRAEYENKTARFTLSYSEDSEGAHWVHFTNELIPDEPETEPDQPPTPEDPPTPDEPDTDKPQPEEPAAPETGDSADMAVWFNVMAVCLIAMTALTFCMLRAVCGRRR